MQPRVKLSASRRMENLKMEKVANPPLLPLRTKRTSEIEKLDLEEHAAMEVFVALEKERRSWKENKKLKLVQKKDRRHFVDRARHRHPAPD